MTFDEFISLCNPLMVSGPTPETIGPIVQDSRKIRPGDVFVAVRGNLSDGHDFIEKAIDAGASIVIAEKDIPLPKSITFVLVKNTRSILGPLALAYLGNPQNALKVIGVTGTNGKTTVSTLIYQILSRLGYKAALLGTISKHIGNKTIPSKLTTSDAIELANDMQEAVQANCDYVVMEASSHALDQDRTAGINFKVGIFTNLTHDHLDYHKTMEAYASAKKKLFDSLFSDSIAIVNGDDSYASFMIRDCQADVWMSGYNDSSFGNRIISNSSDGLILDLDGTIIQSPLVGKFNAYNVMQAYYASVAAGCSTTNVAAALSEVTGAQGRMQKVIIQQTTSVPSVFIDYAHTPDALKNVSETLRQIKRNNQKLHIIFGCGGDRDKTKRPEMAAIAEEYGDYVTVTSDNPRFEDPEKIIDDIFAGFKNPDLVVRNSDRKAAIQETVKETNLNDIILIAGKGHENYQEIKGVRYHLDDNEIARKALEDRAQKSKAGEVN